MAIRASSRASLAKTLMSFYLLASRLGIDGAGHIQIDYTGLVLSLRCGGVVLSLATHHTNCRRCPNRVVLRGDLGEKL
uniref:Uncharacterized protein n=1 Tax=Oryza barthii TaxID=65489 RepID=A0A0D3GYH9_9ORYZ